MGVPELIVDSTAFDFDFPDRYTGQVWVRVGKKHRLRSNSLTQPEDQF